MDIPRTGVARRRLIRWIVFGTVALAAVAAITVVLARLEPAAPSVDRNTVWVDAVKRGPMMRQVRGLGTLVPEEILYIPAPTDGRVNRIHVLPGALVTAGTVLVELESPELRQQAVDSEWNVQSAEAELADLKATLERERLNQLAQTANLQSQLETAKLRADRDEGLFKQGLVVELDYRLSRASADELANRFTIEQQRLQIMKGSIQSQLAVKETSVRKARALSQLRVQQVASLKVRAGVAGVVQQVPAQVGQRVAPGANLAIVVQPEKLKAQLRIPETQAKDILIGQSAEVDTRNGIIPGRVSRIDPAVQDGTVAVDVRLDGELPVPHMGWNALRAHRSHPILEGIAEGSYVYFVHSYYCDAPADVVVASSDYGRDFPAIVGRGSVLGVQFHPEKSQAVGLRMIRNFVRLVAAHAESEEVASQP